MCNKSADSTCEAGENTFGIHLLEMHNMFRTMFELWFETACTWMKLKIHKPFKNTFPHEACSVGPRSLAFPQ